jgi:flagellar biosynthesis anti-sigma factor FlgM
VNIDPRHAPQAGSPAITGRSSSVVPILPAESTAPSGGRPADRVEISADAQTFQRLRVRLDAAVEESRTERIAVLRAALAAGAYAPTGEQIAGALLGDETVAGVLGLAPGR